jgi:hypothetical protein
MPEPDPSPASSSQPGSLRFVAGVIIKALLLFVALNLAYALADPLPGLARASVYNWLVPGRERLPFGEVPDQAYNLSLYQIDAMIASHEVSGPRPEDEYRVLVLGDSSVWGYLLEPEDTLTSYLNGEGYTAPDGRQVRFYNLGYPTISVTKDLLLLSYAMQLEPDMIVWLTTLESLPDSKQLTSPIVQNNAGRVQTLIDAYDLSLPADDPALVNRTFWDRTIAGDRRALADVLRLNLYGFMWAATGIDQFYPESYEPRQEDFEPDDSFYDLRPPLAPDDLALDVLAAGVEMAGDVPVLIVNEPIFVSMGENSHIRYNFFYPRWAYDDYRALMSQQAEMRGWRYLDLWDAVPMTEFTNSAIHVTPHGSAELARRLGPAIVETIAGQ